MADNKSDYLERKVLDHALGTTTFTKPTAVYVSLHTSSPTDAALSTEVVGGSYARQVCAFGSASTATSTTTASNSGAISFTNLPTATITHMGIWDASTSGNLLFHGALGSTKSISSGDTLTFAIGAITIEEQ